MSWRMDLFLRKIHISYWWQLRLTASCSHARVENYRLMIVMRLKMSLTPEALFLEPLSVAVGTVRGRNEGYQAGLGHGFQQGYDEGHVAGWNEAVTEGNKKLVETAGYIQQHVAEKEALQRQLLELQQKLEAMTSDHHNLIRQFNRTMVFVRASRRAFEDLIRPNDEATHYVRAVFAEKYDAELTKSLERKSISQPLETDPDFGQQAPETQAFIRSVLSDIGRSS